MCSNLEGFRSLFFSLSQQERDKEKSTLPFVSVFGSAFWAKSIMHAWVSNSSRFCEKNVSCASIVANF
jgi:hypothetical protein